jgi:hypothetical protein
LCCIPDLQDYFFFLAAFFFAAGFFFAVAFFFAGFLTISALTYKLVETPLHFLRLLILP